MKFNTKSLLLAAAAMLMLPAGFAQAETYTSKVHGDQGGNRQVVESGGTVKVKSGGIVTVDSGATENHNGTFNLGGFAVTVPAAGALALANGTVPVACGATCTLGAANANTVTKIDTAAGSVATLPAATGTGAKYRLIVTVANSSNADKVLTNPVTDVIIGNGYGFTGSTMKVFVGNASTYHSIQMPFAGSQPSGGFVGDEIDCTDIAAALWQCNVKYEGGTTPTTPYSAATS